MDILKTTIIRKGRVRCVWVPDPTTPMAEEEKENVASGKWAALGCILQKRCTNCDEWKDVDSLWGIVIEPTDEALALFARQNMDFSKGIKKA